MTKFGKFKNFEKFGKKIENLENFGKFWKNRLPVIKKYEKKLESIRKYRKKKIRRGRKFEALKWPAYAQVDQRPKTPIIAQGACAIVNTPHRKWDEERDKAPLTSATHERICPISRE